MNKRIQFFLHWIFTIALAAVFIYSGMIKIFDPAQFAQSIANYQILPDVLINVIALYLPWVELFVGLIILWPSWQKAAIVLIVAMTLVFILAVSSAMLRGLDIDCGCFGEGSAAAGIRTLLIDLAIVLTCFFLWFFPKRKHSH